MAHLSKTKTFKKKKKKLKDWKVVAFYNFQQYATHLNVLIIPKKLKWKWTTFGSTHIMRENWKNYVFILWKKRKVWWHFKQCHAVKSKSHRSGGKKKQKLKSKHVFFLISPVSHKIRHCNMLGKLIDVQWNQVKLKYSQPHCKCFHSTENIPS